LSYQAASWKDGLNVGLFIVRKDGTLYAKKMASLPNMVEDITLAVRRLHKQWVLELRR
jgi:hypothetical protein